MPARPRLGFRLAVVLVVTVGLCVGFVLVRSRGPSGIVLEASQLEEIDASGPCSAGRWPVKTLTDAAVASVSLVPTPTTVSALGALARPPGISDSSPRLRSETTPATVSANLYVDHVELDRDIHLVLEDPADGSQMISEFPDPSCTSAADPQLQALMTAARSAYVEACGPATSSSGDYFIQATAQVTGIRLFDTIVGQFGRAPNAIELHPVIGFKITSVCKKSGSPTAFGITSSLAEGSTVRGTIQWRATAQASSVTSLVFAVDNVAVSTFDTGPTQSISFATGRLVDGMHSFSVTATLADGSTSILVDHLVTSNGVAPPAPPALALGATRVRRGHALTVRLQRFPGGAPVHVVAGYRRRRIAVLALVVKRDGTRRASLVLPATAPPGHYTISACTPGCASIATHAAVVLG